MLVVIVLVLLDNKSVRIIGFSVSVCSHEWCISNGANETFTLSIRYSLLVVYWVALGSLRGPSVIKEERKHTPVPHKSGPSSRSVKAVQIEHERLWRKGSGLMGDDGMRLGR